MQEYSKADKVLSTLWFIIVLGGIQMLPKEPPNPPLLIIWNLAFKQYYKVLYNCNAITETVLRDVSWDKTKSRGKSAHRAPEVMMSEMKKTKLLADVKRNKERL